MDKHLNPWQRRYHLKRARQDDPLEQAARIITICRGLATNPRLVAECNDWLKRYEEECRALGENVREK